MRVLLPLLFLLGLCAVGLGPPRERRAGSFWVLPSCAGSLALPPPPACTPLFLPPLHPAKDEIIFLTTRNPSSFSEILSLEESLFKKSSSFFLTAFRPRFAVPQFFQIGVFLLLRASILEVFPPGGRSPRIPACFQRDRT